MYLSLRPCRCKTCNVQLHNEWDVASAPVHETRSFSEHSREKFRQQDWRTVLLNAVYATFLDVPHVRKSQVLGSG